MARILAIDYGKARTGIAISDPLGIIAQPLETYTGRQLEQHVADLVQEQDVIRVLVGMPLHMSGEKGEQAQEVDAFISRLQAALSIPIQTVDERLTSVEAERQLHAVGKKIGADKGAVDRRAAAIMLQSYLDSQSGTNG
jgi:putative holliday junction resolvase